MSGINAVSEKGNLNVKTSHWQGPLVVDLDGSLIKTELPWESFLYVLVHHPVPLMKILWRKVKNNKECYVKTELQKWAKISLNHIPFSEKFLAYLKEEKAKGRELVLCTGSTQEYADKIQEVTGLFDSVWGSTLGKNLVGLKKAMFLVGKYGEKKFDYAGNSFADLKVAQYARRFILVNPSFWAGFFSKKLKIHRQFMEKNLNPSFFSYTLGFPFWFLNCLIFITPLFVHSSYMDNIFFSLAFSLVHFNFLVMAFHIFFKMTHVNLDREDLQKRSDNLFASGDLSLSLGFFLTGLFLFLSFVSLIYLAISFPLTIISSLLYVFCVYLLVHKTIKKWLVPIFLRYILLTAVVLLQGLIIILF